MFVKRNAFLAVLLTVTQFSESNSQQVRTCTNINNNLNTLETLIKNSGNNSIKLICPFTIDSQKSFNISKSNISIICAKENAGDKCLFRGSKRHVNVWGNRITLIGLDFENAGNAAVKVHGNSASFIDCSFLK